MTEINTAKMMIENIEKCVEYRTDDDYSVRENALFWAEILNAWSNHRQADALERIAIALENQQPLKDNLVYYDGTKSPFQGV